MSTDTIVVLDTETTGTSDQPDAALLEISTVALMLEPSGWTLGDAQSYMVAHEGPIPPTAKAVHHITEEMVDPRRHAGVSHPDSNIFQRELILHGMLAAEEPGNMMYAAHNAAFDQHFLPELRLPWICTLRVARHIWPEAPAYGNQVLRYWLGEEPPAALVRGLAPHRALYDTAVTAMVLLRMLRDRTPEELHELTLAPILQQSVGFGKHRGQPWSEIPRDYLRWLRDKSDLYRGDPDLRHTIDHWLRA